MGIFSLFGDSPYKVIDAVYPGQFQPWEFSNVPINYWKKPENIKQMMDYFLFKQLGFTCYKEALDNLNKLHFFQYRHTGLLQMAFNHRLAYAQQWIKEQAFQCQQNKEGCS